MAYAPIIIFAFNRLEPLKRLVTSLLANSEAAESDLYVFVDGARANKEDEKEKVDAVRNYVATISGFRSIHHDFSEENRGLGPSIIRGVTEVINQYGKAIVLEDDLVLATNFLAFMNEGLEKYEHEKKVFSICGYSNRVKQPQDYPYDAYFCTRSSSWGWATWADRWASVDWELKDFSQYKTKAKAFNRWGGSDCWKMLNDWHKGNNKSWAIRFCFAQFLQDKLSLFPIISKVNNEGFDGDGTNCKKWSRFKFDFDNEGRKKFCFPTQVILNRSLYKSAMSYNGLLIRAWSRVMYMTH